MSTLAVVMSAAIIVALLGAFVAEILGLIALRRLIAAAGLLAARVAELERWRDDPEAWTGEDHEERIAALEAFVAGRPYTMELRIDPTPVANTVTSEDRTSE